MKLWGFSGVKLSNRGVGYCFNTDCDDYSKGIFILNHKDPKFLCPRCHEYGKIELERASTSGKGEIFKEVRVEYNFDPIKNGGTYRELAIVRDESIGEGLTYTLYSPLIKTDKRALKVAENSLATLQRVTRIASNEVVSPTEFLMSFDEDRESFSKQCLLFLNEWKGSPRCSINV